MVQQIQFVRDTTVIPGEVMRTTESTANFRTLSSLRMSMRIRFKPAISRSDFVRQLNSYFPEIAGPMDESDFGILPLEIGAMTVATKEAIGNFDLLTVRRHLAFIGDLYERAEAELRKAIQIAYLENLFLGETSYAHVEARCLLSDSLLDALKKSELHFGRLALGWHCFSDIIRITKIPSWESFTVLGDSVVIRTVIGFLLNKDLRELAKK